MHPKDFDPSRTITRAQPVMTGARAVQRGIIGIHPGATYIQPGGTYIHPAFAGWPVAPPPRDVMSHLRNTGVFKGLSGCGCSGKGG